jgi:tetratricopeptide (TPR) repeat protein
LKLAGKDFEDAVKADPNNGLAQNAYAYFLAKSGRPPEAREHLEKSIKLAKEQKQEMSVGFLLNTARTYSQIVGKLEVLDRKGVGAATELRKCTDDAAKYLKDAVAKISPKEKAQFWRDHLHVKKSTGLGGIDPDFLPIVSHPTFQAMELEFTQTKSTRR